MRKKLPRPQKIEITQTNAMGNRIYTVHYEGDKIVAFYSIISDLELIAGCCVLKERMSDEEIIDARRHANHYVGINRKKDNDE